MRAAPSPASSDVAGGRLQLGVTSLVAGYVLSDLLARYRRAFPGVEVSAIEDNGDYLEHLLVGGELDVAVMVISNLRDRMALQAEILEVSPYRLWLPLGHPLAGADIIGIDDIAARAADHADRRRDRGEHRQAAGRARRRARMSPSAPARSRRCAASSPPAPASRCCPTSSTGHGRWKATASRSRDISGSLPVVQVGMVWRRGSGLPQAARDFIGIAAGAAHGHGSGRYAG